MAQFPQPGDTGIRGVVEWVGYVPASGLWAGRVSAFDADWGTPPSWSGDPLSFQFSSSSEFHAGQGVTFDVVAGEYAAYATNVTAA